ncbi:MAG: hypothetical protein Q9224_007453 [Gallowayella concinna]
MQGNGFWIRDGQQSKINPNATQTADAATESSTSPTAPPPVLATAHPSRKSDGLGNGAIAGTAIGAVAGVATISFAIWFLLRRKRRQGLEEQTNNTISGAENSRTSEKEVDSAYQRTWEQEGSSQYLHTWEKDGGHRFELDGHDQPGYRTTELHELVGSTPHRELE